MSSGDRTLGNAGNGPVDWIAAPEQAQGHSGGQAAPLPEQGGEKALGWPSDALNTVKPTDG